MADQKNESGKVVPPSRPSRGSDYSEQIRRLPGTGTGTGKSPEQIRDRQPDAVRDTLPVPIPTDEKK